jgi:hypothetical protein
MTTHALDYAYALATFFASTLTFTGGILIYLSRRWLGSTCIVTAVALAAVFAVLNEVNLALACTGASWGGIAGVVLSRRTWQPYD